MTLTRRQTEILDFLRRHADSLPQAPTLDVLCARLGLRSRGSLHKHIQALIAAGYLEPIHGRHAAIRLRAPAPEAPTLVESAAAGDLDLERDLEQDLDGELERAPALDSDADGDGDGDRDADPDALPFLGKITAGRPSEALVQAETLRIPPHLRTAGRCYVLAVSGDSMCEAGILDGDLVVVEQRDWARNGEIVVALLHGQEVTLKRIRQQPGMVILEPCNRDLEPLVLAPDAVEIQGVVVAQMRAY